MKQEYSFGLPSIVFSLIGLLFLAPFSFADLLKGFEAQKRGDYETAIKEFKSSADAGDEKAIFFLGTSYKDLLRDTYKRGGDRKPIAQAAISALEPFALRGNSEAQYQLAQIYGLRDFKQKFDWLLKAAVQEHGLAQWELGTIYEQGEDLFESFRVDPNYYEARKWYEKAANNGLDVGMESLGRLYANGKGVSRNYAMAIRWFEAAIREGNSGALLALGSLYELGKGVPRDQKKAEELYSTAVSRGSFVATELAKERVGAAKGDADAEYRLGELWLGGGVGLVEDIDEALRLINKAADKFHPGAISALGFMYKKGWKVPQDYVMACKWYNIGAALGDGRSKHERDAIAKMMTPSQLADAQKLAREWMESRRRR